MESSSRCPRSGRWRGEAGVIERRQRRAVAGRVGAVQEAPERGSADLQVEQADDLGQAIALGLKPPDLGLAIP